MTRTIKKNVMNKKGALVALVSALLLNSLPVYAAEGTGNYEFDPVLVHGEKDKKQETNNEVADKIDDEPSYSRLAIPESSKAATEIFTRDDIEKMHPKSVIEIIEQGLGMMSNYKGRKDINNISGRGGENIGIVIDGVYIPWSQSSRVLANFPVDMIESVKLVRDSTILTAGPMTALTLCNGSPNQGFIIIKTRKSTQEENELKLGYGTFNTQKFSFLHGNKVNDFYYDVAYSKTKTDGKDGWNNAKESDSFLVKGGYTGKNFIGNMSFYVDQSSRQLQRGIKENDTYGDSVWEYNPLDTMMFSLDMAKPWNSHNTTAFSFGYSSVKADLIQHNFNNYVFKEREYLREYNLSHNINTGKNTFKFGGQAIYWHSPTGAFNYEGIERQEELYGYYLYDEYLADKKWTVDGGMRIDRKHITKGIDRYRHDGSTGLIELNDTWANNATSYTLGTSYKINNIYKLSTKLSYSVQPPDEYSDGGMGYNVRTMLPVRVNSGTNFPDEERFKTEIGINANYSKALNASLTLFDYDIDNYKVAGKSKLITKDAQNHKMPLNQWYFIRPYSVADLNRKGLELQLNGHLANSLTYKLGYSYLISNNDEDSDTFPHNIYTCRLSHQFKDIETSMTARHVGSYSMNEQKVGDFTTLDATITKNLDENSKITLFGKNITNSRYATVYAIPQSVGSSPEGYYYDEGAVYGIEYSKNF